MFSVSVCVWYIVLYRESTNNIYLKDVFMHAHREVRIGEIKQFGLEQKLEWSALDERKVYI